MTAGKAVGHARVETTSSKPHAPGAWVSADLGPHLGFDGTGKAWKKIGRQLSQRRVKDTRKGSMPRIIG